MESTFFHQNLHQSDGEVWDAIAGETQRLDQQIELIASENLVSAALLEAQGSVLTNKYAEGYPGRRYYGGCEYMDAVESLAIERAQRLFDCAHVNVQPHSGAQANAAVLFALCKPGDTIMGMALDAGGHLTHGAAPTLSGKWFQAVSYGVRREDSRIDYDQVEELAQRHKPALIIAGGSAYPRIIDFSRFRAIADANDAMLMVDMAHFAGLVAAGVHPSPLPHAHVVTTTTHKTLRGPRGGMILCKDPQLAKRINSAVFPGTQGGPLMHVIAAKAVALGEALQPQFREYGQAVLDNARTLADTLRDKDCALVADGTDTHLLLVDLRPQGITGKAAEALLEKIGITCNKNAIPFDPQKPAISSGIRLGTPATTTRGFRAAEFRLIGEAISRALHSYARDPQVEDDATLEELRQQMGALCRRFPVYQYREQVRKSA